MVLKVISVAIVILGALWISEGAMELPRALRSAPEVLELGPEFMGSAQLPAETIREAFESARQRMLSANSAGRWFRITGDIGVWLSFVASASVTVLLGWCGYAPATGPPIPENEHAKLSRSAVRWIGSLAAVAAVLTALGNLAQSYAQRQYERSDSIQTLLIDARKEVLDARTEEDARAVLDNLESKSARI